MNEAFLISRGWTKIEGTLNPFCWRDADGTLWTYSVAVYRQLRRETKSEVN